MNKYECKNKSQIINLFAKVIQREINKGDGNFLGFLEITGSINPIVEEVLNNIINTFFEDNHRYDYVNGNIFFRNKILEKLKNIAKNSKTGKVTLKEILKEINLYI